MFVAICLNISGCVASGKQREYYVIKIVERVQGNQYK